MPSQQVSYECVHIDISALIMSRAVRNRRRSSTFDGTQRRSAIVHADVSRLTQVSNTLRALYMLGWTFCKFGDVSCTAVYFVESCYVSLLVNMDVFVGHVCTTMNSQRRLKTDDDTCMETARRYVLIMLVYIIIYNYSNFSKMFMVSCVLTISLQQNSTFATNIHKYNTSLYNNNRCP